MHAMFDRLDEFAKTLPEPKLGAHWDAYYDQHIRNAERMRAEAFKYTVLDIARRLRAARQALGSQLSALRSRAQAQAERPLDAPQGGAD
jgi:hypothetical protein